MMHRSVNTNGSHILTTLGASPANETGAIVGNVISGLANIVGSIAGIVKTPGASAAAVSCKADIVTDVENLRSLPGAIASDQALLASMTTDDARQKPLTQKIQTEQAALQGLQDKLSATIKTTIDPGISALTLDGENDATTSFIAQGDGKIANDGLVARIAPGSGGVKRICSWFNNCDPAIADVLSISVYLDFKHGQTLGQTADPSHWAEDWHQTVMDFPKNKISNDYRDPAHIPVEVWYPSRPDLSKPDAAKQLIKDGKLKLLAAPTVVAFGQFGIAQNTPNDAKLFEKLNWTLTFNADGSVANASFTSQARGLAASQLLKGGTQDLANATNSIVNATSDAADSVAFKQKADKVYQERRYLQCMNPQGTCPLN
ncbi:hypothetical protein ACNHKD_04415 [Methylocystis sp. JAN1]|uniref:hypothetical protein n=1 Tax=Methylocystis sp. JAN1 TaxID=3397211 RepID=UPI003FA23CDC